jgi:hypothetical protein
MKRQTLPAPAIAACRLVHEVDSAEDLPAFWHVAFIYGFNVEVTGVARLNCAASV